MKRAFALVLAMATAAACSAPLDASDVNRGEQGTHNGTAQVSGGDSLANPTLPEACMAAWSAMPAAQKQREEPREAFLGRCTRTGRWIVRCTDDWIEYGSGPPFCPAHGGAKGFYWQPDG